MTMRLCGGCRSKIPDSVRFCSSCTAERAKRRTDSASPANIKSHDVADRVRFHFLYSDRRWWERLQPKIMKQQPFCARCQTALSEICDHIVPAGVVITQAQESGRWPLDKFAGFYFPSNLQALCRSCHGLKTIEDKSRREPWPDAVAKHLAQPRKVWSF